MHIRQRPSLSLLTLVLAVISSVLFWQCSDRKGPGNADDALSSFDLADGFRIELLASEPLVGDPVDIEIDESGRLYVVEMPGYPLDKSGTGKVKLLFDNDGDGRMDSATVFADNMVLPNSVMRWKNGILVTDAPYVLYFEDRDNDGRAEVRDTVLTGFALSNPQHNLNSPLLGIDNWIYLAHEGAVSTETYAREFGDPGKAIQYHHRPASPALAVNANGRSVRFRPDRDALEETSGHSQFGHTFDAYGHHFLVGNADHIYQEVIAARYLNRNSDYLISRATESISDHGNAAEVFPITQNPQHQLLTDIGVITSACGLTWYLGGGFPPPYDDHVTFVAEPVSNLVHVDKVQSKGASAVASRVVEHAEFLASRDAKFRPVNLYVGPDGALYVVDYYRQVIEHPEWMASDVITSGTLYNDSAKGRIYRIAPEKATAAAWTKGLKLGEASSASLVETLGNHNAWWRMHAQRLLVDRGDAGIVPALRTMAQNKTSAIGRLHALWTMEGLGVLNVDDIAKALRDTEPGVRENAIRMAELHLKDGPSLASALVALADDDDPRVRYQLMCTLGDIATPESEVARKKILFRDIADPWIQVAALSSPPPFAARLFDEVFEMAIRDTDKYRTLLQQLSALQVTATGGKNLDHIILEGTRNTNDDRSSVQVAILNGLATGAGKSKDEKTFSSKQLQWLESAVFEHRSAAVGMAATRLLAISHSYVPSPAKLNSAIAMARDIRQPDDRRALSITFAGLNPVTNQAAFASMLSTQEPLPVQLAALKSLSAIRGTGISQTLIKKWNELTPAIHDAAIATFLQDEARIDLLLQAINDGKIQSSSVSWPRRVGLMAQSDSALRNRARVLFTQNDEQQVRTSMAHVLELKGNAVNGATVYQENCGLCHQMRGKSGISLGPDLGTVHNWSAEAILSNIIHPNQSISSGFDLCRVELYNGEIVQGLIASESPAALTLKNNGTADRTVARPAIKSLTTLNMSVMPGDFEQKLTPQQLADLLAYLKKNQ